MHSAYCRCQLGGGDGGGGGGVCNLDKIAKLKHLPIFNFDIVSQPIWMYAPPS